MVLGLVDVKREVQKCDRVESDYFLQGARVLSGCKVGKFFFATSLSVLLVDRLLVGWKDYQEPLHRPEPRKLIEDANPRSTVVVPSHYLPRSGIAPISNKRKRNE